MTVYVILPHLAKAPVGITRHWLDSFLHLCFRFVSRLQPCLLAWYCVRHAQETQPQPGSRSLLKRGAANVGLVSRFDHFLVVLVKD